MLMILIHNLPIILKSIDNVEFIEFSQPTLDDVFYTFTQGKKIYGTICTKLK